MDILLQNLDLTTHPRINAEILGIIFMAYSSFDVLLSQSEGLEKVYVVNSTSKSLEMAAILKYFF